MLKVKHQATVVGQQWPGGRLGFCTSSLTYGLSFPHLITSKGSISTLSSRVSGHFPTICRLLQAASNTSFPCLFSAPWLDEDHTEESTLGLQTLREWTSQGGKVSQAQRRFHFSPSAMCHTPLWIPCSALPFTPTPTEGKHAGHFQCAA